MFTRSTFRALATASAVGLWLASVPAFATTFTVSGTISGTNPGTYPVSASATFFTSGSTLRLTLENTSTTAPTRYGAQVFSSFYFDLLVGGTARPVLTYTSGSGNVFKITGTSAALPYLYVPPTTSGSAFTPLPIGSPQPSNLKSSNPDDDSWYFRSDLNESLKPFCRFGIGTVGNSGTVNGFNPNNFPATYVNGINFGIFTGDGSDPKGLLASQLPYLVKDSGTFWFTADRDLENFEFLDPFVFGFGTDPDQTITIVPEPAGVALVGILALGGGVWFARRRSPRLRAVSRSFAMTVLVVGLVVGLALAGQAAPIETITWDFNNEADAAQWTALNTYSKTPVPQDPKWTWVPGSGSTPGTWRVGSVGVSSPVVKFGNYLTSQLIQLSPELPTDKFTFSFAHRFRMPTNGFVVNGVQLPVVAGQFEYSLDGAAFLPVFKSDWTVSGPVSPILSPFVQSSTWTAPQFVPGVAPVVSLPPLIDGGASFTGVSEGRDSGWYVASQAFEVDIPGLTSTIQFRFTKMDLASNCGIDPGWDLRFAQADLILAPEPGSATMAAAGGALVAAAAMLRCRYQRASRPSVRP